MERVYDSFSEAFNLPVLDNTWLADWRSEQQGDGVGDFCWLWLRSRYILQDGVFVCCSRILPIYFQLLPV